MSNQHENATASGISFRKRGASFQRRWRWLGAIGPYLGLILIFLVFCALTWQKGNLHIFVGVNNLRLIAIHAAVTATIALGMTLVMISGGIDLSVGYVVSLVTVTTVLAYGWTQSSIAAIGCGLLTGAGAGFVNGLVITQLRVVPFVATLGMMGVAHGLSQLLAGNRPVRFSAAEPPAWVPFLGEVTPEPLWLGVSPSVWSVLFLAILAWVLLKYTVLGRHCFAIGSNEATARLCGIPINRTKVIIYTLAGLATGWAGIIFTARIQHGMFNIGVGMELVVIAAVVIGGASLSGGEGSISGTLAGVLILGVLENGCTKIELANEYRLIFIGLIIVGVTALNTWRQKSHES